MVGLVHRGIAAAIVGLKSILLETRSGVIVRRFDDDVNAPSEIAKDRPAVALGNRERGEGNKRERKALEQRHVRFSQ